MMVLFLYIAWHK